VSGYALATHSWPASYGEEARPRMGFFTDTSLCIGCKACEVACKEWNDVPEDGLSFSGNSYDNTGHLSADTWRHVAFIEQRRPLDVGESGPQSLVQQASLSDLMGEVELPVHGDAGGMRWLMSSDVCKHCTNAACLEVCPTGALFRTEFGTVVVQPDVCNGCGYCVPACPFGVLSRREGDGRAWKCTLCYDRLRDGEHPACAKACPTQSIQYGELEDLRQHAAERVTVLQQRGERGARLYGADGGDAQPGTRLDGVGGTGAFFLLLDEPEVYGLPPDPVDTTAHLGGAWAAAGVAAVSIAVTVAGAVFGARSPRPGRPRLPWGHR
jgi:formate dehydrogenase iron-sulfur subunit